MLQDALFETSTFDEWQAVLTPKVKGAMNLHTVLDGTPLDFFVCLSSVAGALGNAGQASYAGSNSFLDAFCRWRGRKGLPAASINLPAVQDVGYVAESVARGATSFDADIYGFSITGADLQLLIKAIVRGGLMSFNQNGNQVLVGPSKRPEVGNHPRLRHAFFTLVRHSVMTQTSNQNLGVATIASSSTGGRSEILVDKEALKHAVDIGEASKIVFESLAQKLAKEMTISPDDIALETSLTELGLDSLIAVGFRNWIATELKANVPVMDIVGSGSVNDLVAKVMQRSTLLVRFRDKA